LKLTLSKSQAFFWIFSTSLFFYFFNYLLKWPLLAYFQVRGESSFGDLRVTFEQASCENLPSSPVSCSRFLYGESLRGLLKHFVLSEYSVQVLGCLLTIVFLYVWAAFASNYYHSFCNIISLGFIVLTPPVQLLLERGNIDIAIFVFVYLSWFLFQKNQIFLSFVLVTFLSLSKYYTIFMQFLLVLNRNKFVRILFAIIFLTTTVIVGGELSDSEKVSEIGETSVWASFGFRNIPRLLASEFGMNYTFALTAQAVIILFSIILVTLEHSRKNVNGKPSITYSSFSSWALVLYLTCYFVGTSYDYRLVFLLASSPLLLNKGTAKRNLLNSIFLMFIIMGCFWVGPVQLIGDILQVYFVAVFVSLLIRPIIESHFSIKEKRWL
jgi:hypothetical protein